jgi:hypothetical protein
VHQTAWQSKGKPQLSQHCTHFYTILTLACRVLKSNLGAEGTLAAKQILTATMCSVQCASIQRNL